MASLDEIKKKLNLDELDKDTRANMFNKFVEKGGKVIAQEKKTQNTIRFNREQQKIVQDKMKSKNEELRKRDYSYSNNSKNSKDENKQKKHKRYFSVFLSGIFQGLFTFSNKFTPKFSLAIQNEFGEILSTLNYSVSLIINMEPEKKWEAFEVINKNPSYSFELLMRIYNLYKLNSISRMQSFFKNFNNIICPEVIDDIKLFYKELLILHPYWETTKEVVWKSLLLYEQITGKAPLINRSKLNKFIDSLLGYYFPNFHLTLNYNIGEKTPYEYEVMYKNIGVTPEEEFGVYTKQLIEDKKRWYLELEKEKEERKKLLEESVEKKEIDKLPKYVQKGLQIIDNVIEKIKTKSKDDSKAKNFQPNEKMLHFYFLFKEFDEEFSFILTTSQIRITPRTEGGKRIDIKSEFDEENIKFNEVNSFVREYFSLMEQFNKLNEELRNNPIALSQKITLLNSKRMQTFNEIRTRSSVFFKRFSISLQKLINDYNQEKILLQNGDDLLHFQVELGEKRKFEGISIIKAIAAAFSFSSALHYYVTSGKLSSKGLLLDQEEQNEKDAKGNVEEIKVTDVT
ncbi:MAG TPA: hypothetical protein PK771_04465 [Spirochaetota bacterium]|nr:hypothetical protein [Spirochaetota bacterium]